MATNKYNPLVGTSNRYDPIAPASYNPTVSTNPFSEKLKEIKASNTPLIPNVPTTKVAPPEKGTVKVAAPVKVPVVKVAPAPVVQPKIKVAPAPVAKTPAPSFNKEKLKQEIVKHESGNDYSAVGKYLPNYGTSALGKYQIMPNYHFSKIGLDWKNPNDVKKFLNTPALQDTLYSKIIDETAAKYNNDPAKILAYYYGGDAAVKKYGTSAGDVAPQKGFPSINEYVNRSLKNVTGTPPLFNQSVKVADIPNTQTIKVTGAQPTPTISDKIANYFEPTPNVRARDVVREIGAKIASMSSPMSIAGSFDPENQRKAALLKSSLDKGLKNLTPEEKSALTEQGINTGLMSMGIKEVGSEKLFQGAARTAEQEALQQKILKAKSEEDALLRSNSTAPLPDEFPVQAQEVRTALKNSPVVENVTKYKDIGNTKATFADIFRNTEQVFGKDFPVIKKTILDPFDAAKGPYIDFLENEKKALREAIPFNPGSTESKFIQRFGEGKTSYDELISKFGKAKADAIVEADSFFRSKYDELLTKLNAVEQQIYPNSPQRWTPRRADYYQHFYTASNDFSRLQNILEHPTKIDPLLVGKADETAPKTKWAGFRQRRYGNKTNEDAVGGFINYLKSAGYALHIDPHIGKFRELAGVLERGTGATKNLNRYILSLKEFADNLAGKSTNIDRAIVEHIPGGRQALSVLTFVNNRVKANTILFNARSSMAQVLNLPQGIASAGPINSAKGVAKTLGQIFVKNKPMAESTFLKERYFKGFSEFDKGILKNTKKFGVWMAGVLDEATTKAMWNAQYSKALNEGVPNAVKYADDATRKLVAGRGIGEKPLIQNSQFAQLVMPFQYEMTNFWFTMEDLAKSDKSIAKKMSQFATLFASIYILDNLFEKTTGARPLFDPIEATLDGIKELQAEPNLKGVAKAGGRAAGEVLSNVPFGPAIATQYPEYGIKPFGVQLPSRKELFGSADPTRYGSGLLLSQAVTDPLFKGIMPYGGGQLKKTLQGIGAVDAGKSTTAAGAKQYNIEQTPMNYLKGSVFGKYALPEAQQYYRKKEAPKNSQSNSNRYNPI